MKVAKGFDTQSVGTRQSCQGANNDQRNSKGPETSLRQQRESSATHVARQAKVVKLRICVANLSDLVFGV